MLFRQVFHFGCFALLNVTTFAIMNACASTTLRAQDAASTEAAGEENKPAPLFPDPGLEAAVRAEVFDKRFNQEPLTVDDVKKISRVVGVGKGIKSLEGLQHCSSVMLIDIGKNEINDLTPLSGLKKLQSITLSHNQISDIKPLEELVAVQLLDLSGNQVASLDPIQKMQNLRSLWVADNQIKSLDPVAQLPKVWSLDVAGNKLAEITPVGKLRWLTNLNLDRNEISSLDALKPLTGLSILLIRDNKLTDLTPLVEMCRKDAEGEKQFAPYLRLYIKGNPLSEVAENEQLAALKEVGVRVNMD